MHEMKAALLERKPHMKPQRTKKAHHHINIKAPHPLIYLSLVHIILLGQRHSVQNIPGGGGAQALHLRASKHNKHSHSKNIEESYNFFEVMHYRYNR